MEWSQSEIAEVLGTTQSAISRQYHREAPKLHGSADEILIDDLARDISEIRPYGGGYRPNQTALLLSISIRRTTTNLFDKTLTGKDAGRPNKLCSA